MKKEKKYTIIEIANALKSRRCLNCKGDIDKSFNYKYKWTVPLCKKCRLKYLKELKWKIIKNMNKEEGLSMKL